MRWCSKCDLSESVDGFLCAECRAYYERFQQDGSIPPRRVPIGACSGVYFIASGEFIKIGVTTHVGHRARALQTGSPHDIAILGVLPIHDQREAYQREEAIHEHFADKRHRDEWFRDCPEIRAFIAKYAITEYFNLQAKQP